MQFLRINNAYIKYRSYKKFSLKKNTPPQIPPLNLLARNKTKQKRRKAKEKVYKHK